MTVALQIRDVPEDVRDALAMSARAKGQSLQAYLLALVEAEARRARNVALVARFEGRSDGYSGDEDTAGTVAAMRRRREGDVSDRHGDAP